MNDFTKEELNNLFKCVRMAEMYHGECSDLDNIKFKLKYMIDNYCDHEYMTFLQDQNNEPFIEKCMECHELRIFNE